MVEHEIDNDKFVINKEGHKAELKYQIIGDHIDFYSTFTPTALRGQGLAQQLVEVGLKYAHENRLKIKASCWYVAKYLEEHPAKE